MDTSQRRSILIATAAFLVGGFAFFYYYTSQNTLREVSLHDLRINEKTIFGDIPASDTFKKFDGEETGTKYKYLEEELIKMRAELKPDVVDTEQLFNRAVYYKKLASMAFVNVEDAAKKEEMVLEAYDGLYDGIFSIDEAYQTDNRDFRHLRRLYVYVINYMYGFDSKFFLESRFGTEPYLKSLVQKFPDDKHIAATLYINDKLFNVLDLQRDNYLVSIKMLNLARLLYRQSVAADTALKAKIVNETASLRAIFPTASTTKLTSSAEENATRPYIDYALALGILARFDIVTLEEANESFETAITNIDKYARSEEDNLYYSKLVLQVNQAALLYHKAGRKMTPDVTRLTGEIQKFKEKFKNNRQMTAILREYIARAGTSRTQDLARQDLVDMARQDATLKDTLIDLGLKI